MSHSPIAIQLFRLHRKHFWNWYQNNSHNFVVFDGLVPINQHVRQYSGAINPLKEAAHPLHTTWHLIFLSCREKTGTVFALWAGTSLHLPLSLLPLFLFPSHSLLSDVDWIRLEMGGAETEALLMKMTMQLQPFWYWDAQTCFLPQENISLCNLKVRHKRRETSKHMVPVCSSNWKGNHIRTWIKHLKAMATVIVM